MTEWKENGDDAHWRRLKKLTLLLVAKVLKAHAFEENVSFMYFVAHKI